MADTLTLDVGAHVILAVPDGLLQERYGVIPDVTVGQVVAKVGTKWTVDWGAGAEVPCDTFMLDPVPAPAIEPEPEEEAEPAPEPVRSQILIDQPTGMAFLVKNTEERSPEEFEREPDAADRRWAVPVGQKVYAPQLNAHGFTALLAEAHRDGYDVVDFPVEVPGAPDGFTARLHELLHTHIQAGHHEQAGNILDALGATFTHLTVQRGQLEATFTADGGYISGDDTAFRDLFHEHWKSVCDVVLLSRKPWWQRTKDAAGAFKGTLVAPIELPYVPDRAA